MKHDQVVSCLKKHVTVGNSPIVVDLVRSHGSWLVEKTTNKHYLDCFSQFASQPIGWNHTKMLAQKDRLLDASLHKVANPDIYSVQYAEFAEAIGKITPDHKYKFFIEGGAIAVENALKTAFDWKARKLEWDEDKSGSFEVSISRMDVIHLREAFHGRSGYTLSLTNNPRNRAKTKNFPKFFWTRVFNPKIHEQADIEGAENSSLKLMKEAFFHRTVAAIILEPIQGEGGDNHFRPEFLKAVRQLADENEALLIFDEVQTGVGLTGRMWAYQHFNVTPDLLVFGKKTQTCGFCSTGRIDDIEDHVFKVPSRICSTWGGNLVDMVRATMFLEIIEEDRLVENAHHVGEYFLSKLKDAGFDARGRGLMIAFDLPDTEERDAFLNKLRRNLLALPCGHKSIRFRPHLTFTKEDADVAIDFLKAV